jgi:proton glutamate symport protein
MTDTPSARRFRFTLTYQILLGLVVGCLIGWLFPDFAMSLDPISQIFLRMIRVLVGPLLFTTLVVGLAGAGAKLVGRLGLKAILWFELATTVALVIGMITANLVEPGVGAQGKATAALDKLDHAKTWSEFLINMFPTSMFDALARNDVLQIVVFSVAFGLAVSAAGSKAKLIKDIAEAGAEVMFKLVDLVMRFAPFGVAAAIAVTLGKNGTGVIVSLLKCVLALYASLLVFFALLFTALKLLTRTHLPSFLRAIREPALIAFTTATSEAALPRAMEALEQLGIPRRLVGFVVPTGYSFNLDGTTLYLSLALMFMAQFSGIEMSLGEQLAAMGYLMVASKGVAGVRGAALVVLYGTLDRFHFSPISLQLLIGIDAFMDMGRTCVNVVGNCVATVVVANWEKAIPADAPVFGPGAARRPVASPEPGTADPTS